MEMLTDTQMLDMIEDIENNEEELTDWERKFIEDLEAKLADEEYVSPQMQRKLQEIHDKVC